MKRVIRCCLCDIICKRGVVPTRHVPRQMTCHGYVSSSTPMVNDKLTQRINYRNQKALHRRCKCHTEQGKLGATLSWKWWPLHPLQQPPVSVVLILGPGHGQPPLFLLAWEWLLFLLGHRSAVGYAGRCPDSITTNCTMMCTIIMTL